MANHLFTLPSGRRLGVSAAGDPASRRIVVLCHPTPGAGGFDPDPVLTEQAGVHLMMFDRPGYGASDALDPGERPTVHEHADDLAEILHRDETDARSTGADYGPVGVIGWGSGGRYALSLAARHPELVDEVIVVGTPAPGRVGSGTRTAEFRDLLPVPVTRSVDDVARELSSRGRAGVGDLGADAGDVELEQRMGLRRRLERMLDEAQLQGWTSIASDLVAASQDDWSTELDAVTARVLLVYGDDDPTAGPDDAAWYARHLGRAEQRIVPSGTHLVLVSEWEQILRRVAPEGGDVPERLRDPAPPSGDA